ncbi:MAG TPA: hypothetical protein DCE14_05915 [Kosmotogaceae bacterium]|nr:hypothetical protein [Kosmotogaceae bacterium]
MRWNDLSRHSRLQWIHRRLKDNRHPSGSEIAQALKISRSQVYEDIHYMKHVLGAPIKHSRKFMGYRYTSRYDFPVLFDSALRSNAAVTFSGTVAETVSMFRKALNERTVLRITLDNKSKHLFSCYGLSPDELVAFGFLDNRQSPELVQLQRVSSAGFTRARFREEILLGSRRAFTDEEMMKGSALIKGKEVVFFFWSVSDVVDWLSKEKIRIISPSSLIRDLKAIAEKINGSLDVDRS